MTVKIIYSHRSIVTDCDDDWFRLDKIQSIFYAKNSFSVGDAVILHVEPIDANDTQSPDPRKSPRGGEGTGDEL